MKPKIATHIAGLALMAIAAGVVKAEPKKNPGQKSGAVRAKVKCEALNGWQIPAAQIGLPTGGATITSAKENSGWGERGTPDYVPPFCDILATIAPLKTGNPPINFGLNIPSDWNQKTWQVDGNGRDGFIPLLSAFARDRGGSPEGPAFPPNSAFPIAQGYATYGSDSGHQGGRPPWPEQRSALPPDVSLAALPPNAPDNWNDARATFGNAFFGNDESLVNFAYEQIKKTHDAAMAIIDRMYGLKSRVNYFGGESEGGRAALEAAARFPQDYDGILISIPAAFEIENLLSSAVRPLMQVDPGTWVPPSKAIVIRNEVLRQCDALDGLADGVINDYADCTRLLDPLSTPHPLAKIRCKDGSDTGDDCLSDAQIVTIDGLHSPTEYGYPLGNGEADFPGWPVGTESELLFRTMPDHNAKPGPGALGLQQMFRDPAFDPMKFSTVVYKEKIQQLSKMIDPPTDWSKLLAGRTKVIWYNGAQDTVINANAPMRAYEMIVKQSGQEAVNKSVRFYVAPNVSHGSNGRSATTNERLPQYVDLLAPLENWVENGVLPPDALVQTLMDGHPPYGVLRSKPLCRYPSYPRYIPGGDPEKAESYACTPPSEKGSDASGVIGAVR